MNLRVILFALLSLAVAELAALPFFAIPLPLRYYLAAGGAVVALISIFFLNRKVVGPMETISAGVVLLREQDFSSRLARVGQRNADNIASVFNTMMETLKNERLKTLEQNHFLGLLIEASPAGIVILDFDDRIKSANPMALRIFGEKEVGGRRLAELPSEVARAAAGVGPGGEKTVRPGDSDVYRISCRTFLDKGFHRRFLMIESLSEEVMQAEKEAYGKVIRRMAHEVNNTVGGILPLLNTVKAVCGNEELAEVTDACAERGVSLSRFITRYADLVRLPAPVMAPVDLNAMSRGMLPFWESMASASGVEIRLEESAGPVVVMADTMLMEQVMVNIIKNSIESVESARREGGFVEVTVSGDPGGLTVTDNGGGITPEVSEHLFTPFYTSKKDGNGIGLTLVSEILRAHGCRFSLRTSPDALTRFRLHFPPPPTLTAEL